MRTAHNDTFFHSSFTATTTSYYGWYIFIPKKLFSSPFEVPTAPWTRPNIFQFKSPKIRRWIFLNYIKHCCFAYFEVLLLWKWLVRCGTRSGERKDQDISISPSLRSFLLRQQQLRQQQQQQQQQKEEGETSRTEMKTSLSLTRLLPSSVDYWTGWSIEERKEKKSIGGKRGRERDRNICSQEIHKRRRKKERRRGEKTITALAGRSVM